MNEHSSCEEKGTSYEDGMTDQSDIVLMKSPNAEEKNLSTFRFDSQPTRNQSRKSLKRLRADEWHADHRVPSSLENPAWEKFYRRTVVPEEDWNAFVGAMRRSLPMSLRVNIADNYREHAGKLAAWLKWQLSSLFESADISFFLPEGYAFQCDVSRGVLKRDTALKKWKEIISALNEGGYITRQETVSMLPPVLLQVEPGHRVLDMCAAPGSKSSQVLERLVSAVGPGRGDGKEISPTARKECGILVANDVSVSRLDILHHQTNRSTGAHPHLIITNYDAARFPLLPPEDRFHRVLCDVMCSGDGTLRKSIDLWPRWNVLLGPSLHSSQCRVLRRGMKLCQENGIVVYSTCSLNPVEDEAVVSTCLTDIEKDGGKFELLDPRPFLRGWKYCPGLTEWTLWSEDSSTRLRTYEDAEKSRKEKEESKRDYNSNINKRRKAFRFLPSMFPNVARLREQHIEYCCRILPHLQDTGGFFVAVMHCAKAVPCDPKQVGPEGIPNSAFGQSPLQPPTDALREAVVRGLELPLSFPLEGLLARNETKREQKLYYAHPSTIAFSHRLGEKVMSVGSKVFEAVFKYSWDKFRFASEGTSLLLPLLSPRFVLSVLPKVIAILGAKSGTMSESDFLSLIGKDSNWFSMQPPCILLRCVLPQLCAPQKIVQGKRESNYGQETLRKESQASPPIPKEPASLCEGVENLTIVVGVELIPSSSRIKTKVAPWQEALCRWASSTDGEVESKENSM